MANIVLLTNLPIQKVLEIAKEVAHGMGFSIHRLEDGGLAVQKGNFVASLFFGAFIAYCNFRVVVETPSAGTTRLTLERNTPWWTGVIGIGRVKSWAKSLTDAYANELQSQGGELIQCFET